jgi:hypothetical protein
MREKSWPEISKGLGKELETFAVPTCRIVVKKAGIKVSAKASSRFMNEDSDLSKSLRRNTCVTDSIKEGGVLRRNKMKGTLLPSS